MGHLVTGQGPANAVVQVQPGMLVQPVVIVDHAGNLTAPGTLTAAAPGLVTAGGRPSAVVQVQPGMQVRPAVVVDGTGGYVLT